MVLESVHPQLIPIRNLLLSTDLLQLSMKPRMDLLAPLAPTRITKVRTTPERPRLPRTTPPTLPVWTEPFVLGDQIWLPSSPALLDGISSLESRDVKAMIRLSEVAADAPKEAKRLVRIDFGVDRLVERLDLGVPSVVGVGHGLQGIGGQGRGR